MSIDYDVLWKTMMDMMHPIRKYNREQLGFLWQLCKNRDHPNFHSYFKVVDRQIVKSTLLTDIASQLMRQGNITVALIAPVQRQVSDLIEKLNRNHGLKGTDQGVFKHGSSRIVTVNSRVPIKGWTMDLILVDEHAFVEPDVIENLLIQGKRVYGMGTTSELDKEMMELRLLGLFPKTGGALRE